MAGENEVVNQSETARSRRAHPRPQGGRLMTDDELNAAIWVEVMGWLAPDEEDGTTWARDIKGHWFEEVDGPWKFATDIAAAFEVVERMRSAHWDDVVLEASTDGWRVSFTGLFGVDNRFFADSLPRAICEAALAAVREAGG